MSYFLRHIFLQLDQKIFKWYLFIFYLFLMYSSFFSYFFIVPNIQKKIQIRWTYFHFKINYFDKWNVFPDQNAFCMRYWCTETVFKHFKRGTVPVLALTVFKHYQSRHRHWPWWWLYFTNTEYLTVQIVLFNID